MNKTFVCDLLFEKGFLLLISDVAFLSNEVYPNSQSIEQKFIH